MKNQVLLENDYLPRDLIVHIGEFIDYYNTNRPRSALGYRLPAPEVVLPKEISDDDME